MGRNEPCPCGSGRKSKHCCEASQQAMPATGVRASGFSAAAKRNKAAEQFYQAGNALAAQGRMSQAVLQYEQALALKPDFAEACSNLGNALAALGQSDRAIASFERALSIRPDAQIHFNLAGVLEGQGRVDQAIGHYERGLSLRPGHAEAHNNLGSLVMRSRGVIEAVSHLQQAIALKPDLSEAHNNLGLAVQDMGEADEALHHFATALKLNPDFIEARSNLLLGLNYAPGKTPEDVYAAHAGFGRQVEKPFAVSNQKGGCARVQQGRLRLGYVSADFRQHSVAHFIEPVLAHHDHGRFEVFCYANHARNDAVTERLQPLADHWLNIAHLPDEAFAQQIRADGIDILVDLTGHTMNNRLPVFARKPAPVQISWLGYPGTTGLTEMDFRITDGLADPVGMTEHLHTETLVRMPECFSVYQPPDDAPEISVLPARQNGYVTFGSFNKLAKITPAVMKVWAGLLLAVPGSRLMLKTGVLAESAMRQRVQRIFAELGVTTDRLELLGHDESQVAHLKQYARIDIGLDSFPYNGTTTTCEALWMGVPVLTLAGRTHVSRVGVSQMTNLGLTEYVCHSETEYIAAAARLASDLGALDTLRQSLRSQMAASPLMDARRFTAHLEQAYLTLWKERCRPSPLSVSSAGRAELSVIPPESIG